MPGRPQRRLVFRGRPAAGAGDRSLPALCGAPEQHRRHGSACCRCWRSALPALIAEAVRGAAAGAGAALRCRRPAAGGGGVVQPGRASETRPPCRGREVQEDGVRYAADLVAGQKTGFFLDQRDNRLHFGALVREMRGRPGAWISSATPAAGACGLCKQGAGHVTFVDQSREALQLVERGLAANANRRGAGRACTAGTCSTSWPSDRTLYDAVVADPPAFVKSRKNLPKAHQGLPEAEPPGLAPASGRRACCSPAAAAITWRRATF
ncbi:MAG: hypothetical protein MZU91_14880 [Desulfosudis oleivorans]|nr:hypothetical protein [Desulfosudis oleivorans]